MDTWVAYLSLNLHWDVSGKPAPVYYDSYRAVPGAHQSDILEINEKVHETYPSDPRNIEAPL